MSEHSQILNTTAGESLGGDLELGRPAVPSLGIRGPVPDQEREKREERFLEGTGEREVFSESMNIGSTLSLTLCFAERCTGTL